MPLRNSLRLNFQSNSKRVHPLAIYIHWPYCRRICPYCDFNVYKSRGDDEALFAALKAELSHYRELTGPRLISSIHFGGGTPSLLKPMQIADFIETAHSRYSFSGEIEIGLEANPCELDLAYFKALSEAGINRLSFGVQSFDDDVLTFLGRDHNGDQARQSVSSALNYIPNSSVDLIFGHKDQSPEAWQEDLETALELGIPHMSAYQLTIEQGTAFERAERRGQTKAVDETRSETLFILARDMLRANRFEHYEVSNYARPGFHSRHNKTYWTGGDYLGIGPGAHGRVTLDGNRYESETYLRPAEFVSSAAQNGHGRKRFEKIGANDQANEYVMMGLRISEGISLAQYAEIAGQDLEVDLEFIEKNWLIKDGDRLRATDEGRLRLDYISFALLGA